MADTQTTRGAAETVHEEVRLSVVLFGGVSLAIYINGVCQELLRLVRATSGPEPGRGTEHVYRALATISPHDRDRGYDRIAGLLDDVGPEGLVDAMIQRHPPARRFVVDILSGSSAGGLNAVYLAKALVGDRSIDGLKDLWAAEADFARLLNDRPVDADPGFGPVPDDPPKSLLASDRMYLLLLAALRSMSDQPRSRALVERLDCYLTTTDLAGVPVAVRLGPDQTIEELRYRSAVHFAFGRERLAGGPRDDFADDHDAFLAFAARATAAHPAAFVPAQIEHTRDVLWPDRPRRGGAASTQPADAAPTLDDAALVRGASRVRPVPIGGDARRRWYSDGGDLDNKPFTYVLEPLENRRAELPVNRVLLYVEPDPATSRPDPSDPERLPPLAGYTLGPAFLPGKEWIREDIERIHDRNRRVSRLRRALELAAVAPSRSGDDDPDDGGRRGRAGTDPDRVLTESARAGEVGSWVDARLGDLLRSSGPAGLVYEQARTFQLADDLADLLGRLLHLPVGGAGDDAVRHCVRDHFARTYLTPTTAVDDRDRPLPHRRVLLGLDYSYRLRRLDFVDQLLSMFQQRGAATAWGEGRQQERQTFAAMRALRSRLNEVFDDLLALGRALGGADPASARADRLLDDRLDRLLAGGDLDPEAADALVASRDRGLVAEHALVRELIPRLRTEVGDAARAASGETTGAVPSEDLLASFVAAIDAITEPWYRFASTEARRALQSFDADPAAATRLAEVWTGFDGYDRMLMAQWADARGELDEIDVVRVSPLDATALIDESDVSSGRRKLAGTTIHHFGGFLDEAWRRNDILWGRLDAAERLVTTMMPAPPQPSAAYETARAALISAAHRAIIDDERRAPDRPGGGAIDHLEVLTGIDELKPTAKALVDDPATTSEQIRAFLAESFTVDRRLVDQRRQAFDRLLVRANPVVGRMLGAVGVDSVTLRPGQVGRGRSKAGFAALGRLLSHGVGLALAARWRYLLIRFLVLPLVAIGATAAGVLGFERDPAAAGLGVAAALLALVAGGLVFAPPIPSVLFWVLQTMVALLALAAFVWGIAVDWPATLLLVVCTLTALTTVALLAAVLPRVEQIVRRVGEA